jgi:outer membrane receptor protein involved in Fe transport
LSAAALPYGAQAADAVEEITVIGIAPGGFTRQELRHVPYAVQGAGSEALEQSAALDPSDFMNTRLGSVSINAAQNNPLQPDLQFRGFTASPLLGLPQGISVYQNGVRINEPLGDAVNWDLLPSSAIQTLELIGGSNPVFGLNTLGGALALTMKDGFNFPRSGAELMTGSWGRVTGTLESGGNNGVWGYYANLDYFDETGWRDLSGSDARNFYGSVGWRDAETSGMNLSLQRGTSELIGNGALPVGLMAVERSAVFTAPDITENDMDMLALDGWHALNDTWRVSGNANWRENRTHSFNGDLAEDLEEDDEGDDPGDSDAFESAAINNISDRNQSSRSFSGQFEATDDLFGRDNLFITGVNYVDGRSTFNSVVELSGLDPVTRSTAGLGTGIFIDSAATHVRTRTATKSWYFSDTLELNEVLALTLSGRYNATDVTLRDQSGERPELNGDHSFKRFNPAAGLTWNPDAAHTYYASYSESNRVPTPIELACNEGVFELARQYAIEAGEAPDDVDFECRLPNAFLADPPLDDVVTRTVEFGARGAWRGVQYQVNLFDARNRDDILFQTTGRSTGLFANVDATRRRGLELGLTGKVADVSWYANWTYLEASFDSPFMVLSPNHPNANAEGELAVEAGDRIPGMPETIAKLGGDWQLSDAFSLGAEAIYNGNQIVRGDESNELDPMSGYTLVNLRGSYQWGSRLTIFARLTNLFDTDYESFGLLGEDPSEILPGLADTRPLFLGVGAPRAGWIGARYRL